MVTVLRSVQVAAALLALVCGPGAAAQEAQPRRLGSTRALDAALDEIVVSFDIRADKRVSLVWMVDSSSSMTDDRARIRERIAEIFSKLSAKADVRMAVASFDKDARIVTPFTDKAEEVRKGIDAVTTAGAGVENCMFAVGECARALSTNGASFRAVILVTDEHGDDHLQVESAISRAKAAGVKVFVLGRETPFGWSHGYEMDDKLRFNVVVDAGLESAGEETLQMSPLCCHQPWYGWCRKMLIRPEKRKDENVDQKVNPLSCDPGFEQQVPSGYLPWTLARLAERTGGKGYYINSSPSYDRAAMNGYEPELCSAAEWAKRNGTDPMRRAVVEALEFFRKGKTFEMTMEGLTPERARQNMERSLALERSLQQWIKRLAGARAAVATTDEKTARRWVAHRDLLSAQMHAMLHWQEQYRLAIAVPAYPTAEQGKSVVAMAVTATIRGDGALKKAAIAELDKVIASHPGTPWARTAELLKGKLNGFEVKLVGIAHVTAQQGSK